MGASLGLRRVCRLVYHYMPTVLIDVTLGISLVLRNKLSVTMYVVCLPTVP